MKKIISIICAAALIAAMACIGSAAESEAVTFTLVPHFVGTGATEVTVDLVANVAEGSDVTSFGVLLRYDAVKLALAKAENKLDVDGSAVGSEVQANNPYTWMWVGSADGDSTLSFTGEVLLATFTFNVKGSDGASVGTEYVFTLSAHEDGTVLSASGTNYSASGKVAFEGTSITVKNPGDLNDDGEYNLTDVVCILKHLAERSDAIGDIAAGDVDGDGATTTLDVEYYLRAIAGWGGYTVG